MSESRGTILVADDTEANRYVLARLLAKAGYRVLEAGTGEEAWARLAEKPDLVVLDVNLPDMRGTDLTRRIKADPDTAPIMVLNMSASFIRTQDRIHGLDSGADGYLTQPLDPPEFLATVASLMRLRRVEESVRRANRELEHFAYIASHDLQEPLRMVTNCLSLLQHRYTADLDDTARKYIGFAVDGATRMSAMINGLLKLSHAERAPLDQQRIDAGQAIADALGNLAGVIQEAQATVVVGSTCEVRADRSLLSQVFQNLLANAIKYRSRKPPVIRITAEVAEGRCIIRIADNGLGIAPAYQERIFGIFERGTAEADSPGSGIGLAVCKRIIERHGGEIGVESEPGRGSTFWFALPV